MGHRLGELELAPPKNSYLIHTVPGLYLPFEPVYPGARALTG